MMIRFLLLVFALFLVSAAAHRHRPLPPPTTATPTPTALNRHPYHNKPTIRHNHHSNTPPPPRRPAALSPPGIGPLQAFNILDAIIGTFDFGAEDFFKNILGGAELGLPISATLFVLAAGPLPADPMLPPYHTVPERLLFADLRRLKLQSRLPTLLPSKKIVITNNSATNFSVDGAFVARPDLFTTDSIAVHGVAGFLDYHIYGDDSSVLSPPAAVLSPPPPPPAAAVLSPPLLPAAGFVQTPPSGGASHKFSGFGLVSLALYFGLLI